MSDDQEPTQPDTPLPSSPAGSPEEPKKRSRALIVLLGLLVAGGAAAVTFFKVPAFHALLHPHGGADNAARAAKAETKYTCPMHPFIVSDKPGTCPICGMTLVPQASMAQAAGGEEEKKERKILYWTDPMIPGDRSDKPGKSPMGMDRVPVYEDEAIGMVAMNPTQRLMANVATEKAARREFVLDTPAVGKVSWDERRVAKVSSRIGGRVEKLHVDFTGIRVVKGQPLLEIYSPDLVATQREYLVAREGVERMKESPYEDAREMSRSLVEAAKTRLKLWGVTDAQIEDLEKTKEPRTVFTVFAPRTGIVTERLVSAGQYVMEGAPLYSVAQMDPVWVQADVHEFEMRRVPLGTPAVVTTHAYPEKVFRGTATFIDPFLNVETRTAKIRIDLPNPSGLLKPDMFVRVTFQGRKQNALAVPESAVLITGERAMAWVEVKANTFEPRMVRVGNRSNGFYEVLGGLKEGDSVVSSAGFLIDSESQLKSGRSDPHAGHGGEPAPGGGVPSGGAPSASPPPGGHAGHGGK